MNSSPAGCILDAMSEEGADSAASPEGPCARHASSDASPAPTKDATGSGPAVALATGSLSAVAAGSTCAAARAGVSTDPDSVVSSDWSVPGSTSAVTGRSNAGPGAAPSLEGVSAEVTSTERDGGCVA